MEHLTIAEKKTNLEKYLKKYWGYTTRMIDEVMKTGKTPRRAEYLDDGTTIGGKGLLTIAEKKTNLEKYLFDVIGYTYKMVEEIRETGTLDPAYPSKDNNPISPQHYQQGNIQVLDFINDQKFTYLEGNIVKYICRYKAKNGLEDLEKAQYYLNDLIKLVADEDDRIADEIDEEILCG